MRAAIHFFVLAAIASIPWQAIYIIKTFSIGNPPGVWHYGVLGIYPFDIAIFFALICALGEGVRNRHFLINPVRRENRNVFLGALLFMCIGIVSLYTTSHPLVGTVMLVRIMEGVLVLWLMRISALSLSLVAAALCLGGVGAAIIGITQFVTQRMPAFPGLGIAYHSATVLGDSVIEYGDERWLRAYGTFAHPNIFGFYIGAAYLSAAYLYRRAANAGRRLLLLGVANLLLVALFFSFSREAWVALFVAIGVTFLLSVLKRKNAARLQYRGIHPRIMLAITHILFIGCLIFVFHNLVAVRVGIYGLTRLEQRSIQERIGGVEYSLQTIKNNLGKGVGVAQSTMYHAQRDAQQKKEGPAYTYQPVHNVYLLIIEEIGVFGALLVLLFLGARARTLWRKNIPSLETHFFIFTCSAALFDHFFWSIPIGLFLSLLLLFLPVRDD